MKHLAIILSVLSVVYVSCLVGCVGRKTMRHNWANSVVDELTYLQDSRTGLCFAYYADYGSQGTVALTNVPCGAVDGLLLNKE